MAGLRLRAALVGVNLITLLLGAIPTLGQGIKALDSPLDRLAFASDLLAPSEVVAPMEEVGASLAPEVADSWHGFRLDAGGQWKAYIDRRSGRLEIAEGSGLPWIPGSGNQLRLADIASQLQGRQQPDLAALERTARRFAARIEKLLGVSNSTLTLHPGRSGQVADYLWYIDFDVSREGMLIEGARVVFTVNHGNLVQFGTERLPSADVPVPAQRISQSQAAAVVSAYIGGFDPTRDSFVDPGSLHLLPTAIRDAGLVAGFELGKGYGLAKVWRIVFHRAGALGTWRALVDAETGKLLEFVDINEYAQVSGGIYPESYSFHNEVVRPMPFADVSAGGPANSAGRYNYLGGTPSSTLAGSYVKIVDSCGAISKSSNASGQIQFGTSSGTDCSTPGSGGAGNTHASRMQFYWVNRGKEIGRGWLPSATWLSSQLTVNVNISALCNSYWNGSTLNFYKATSGCGNTGEITGLSLHEYGHGLDANDGNGYSPEQGTAEAYADIVAALATHNSCIGNGTFSSSNCGGYGDACTSCSAFRDIDWAKHSSNTPHTVANFIQPHCPTTGSEFGACGREAHCESYVASEALWDFAARDLPGPGSNFAWATADRLWYLSRPTSTKAFNCNTTGATWTSDGCATGSFWRTMRVVDDDDGNLANGTPHSCNLYAAFNRHGIACTSDSGANTCSNSCPVMMPPDLLLSSTGSNSITLDLIAVYSGAPGDVYRNETGCNSGFARVLQNNTSGTWTDTNVANGMTYYYYVVAHSSTNAACTIGGNCLSVTLSGTP